MSSLAVNGKVFARESKSGTARVAEQLVAHIADLRADLDVDVFVPVASGGELLELDWPDRVRIHTSRSPLYATSWGRSLWEQVVLPWKVRRRGGTDLLLNLSNSAPVVLPPGAPQIVLVHDTSFRRREWVSRAFAGYLEFVLALLPDTSRIISASGISAEAVASAFPRLAPIHVIPNAAEEPPEALAPPGGAVPYALFLGALNPRKNLKGAIEGFRSFHRGSPRAARLLIAGAPDPIYRMRSLEPLSSENVQVLGYVSDEDKWSLLAGARLLLLPSFMEGFGLPILEALSVGTPVVASDLPVFHELYYDAIEYIDPEDPEDVARGIERVFSDEGRRRELIERGHRVARSYSWERSAREYLDLIDEICAGDRARSAGDRTRSAREARP